MRFWLCVCVALSLAVLPTIANAADHVSDAALAQAGLSGMQQMTDAQGMDVRGTGFATVSGGSWNYFSPDLGTHNSYSATSNNWFSSAQAVGASNSTISITNTWNWTSSSITSVASGGAFAYAK